MDRFGSGLTQIWPTEVGVCAGCSGMMYDWELSVCGLCDANVHIGCIEECVVCGLIGCRSCLFKHPETGEWECVNCKGESCEY